jgi:hypothetical protein
VNVSRAPGLYGAHAPVGGHVIVLFDAVAVSVALRDRQLGSRALLQRRFIKVRKRIRVAGEAPPVALRDVAELVICPGVARCGVSFELLRALTQETAAERAPQRVDDRIRAVEADGLAAARVKVLALLGQR